MNRKWEVNNVGEGGCACGDLEWKGFVFDVHCHKANCRTCSYGGIHIVKYPKGSFKKAVQIAKRVAISLARSWMLEVSVSKRQRAF